MVAAPLWRNHPRRSPGWPDGLPDLVMAWLPGLSLQRYCGEQAFSTRDAARIVGDLARVLAAVHARGILHRDLKPANVMLVAGDTADGMPIAKLVDFGLARNETGESGLTPTSGVIGTPLGRGTGGRTRPSFPPTSHSARGVFLPHA